MRHAPTKPPKYEEAPLEQLSLEALLRITKKLAEIESKLKDYENVKKPLYDMQLAAYVASLDKEIRELDEKAAPLIERSQLLWQKINSQCIGRVDTGYDLNRGGMLGLLAHAAIRDVKRFLAPNDTSIHYEDRKFPEGVKSEIDAHKNMSQKLTEISNMKRARQAQKSKPKIGPAPRPPARSFLVHDQLQTFTVDADRIDQALLMSLLEEKKAMTLQQQELHQDIKAKARAYDDKQREYAKSIRNKIKPRRPPKFLHLWPLQIPPPNRVATS